MYIVSIMNENGSVLMIMVFCNMISLLFLVMISVVIIKVSSMFQVMWWCMLVFLLFLVMIVLMISSFEFVEVIRNVRISMMYIIDS